MIGSCFASPIGFPDSNSKPDVDSLGFGNSDSWKCFSSASHFFGFSPLIPPDTSLTNPITAPTLCVHPHSQILQGGTKNPAQLSALLGFRFLTILLIPKRKFLPQTKNMSWYLKINVTTVHNYITFGKVRKLGQSVNLFVSGFFCYFIKSQSQCSSGCFILWSFVRFVPLGLLKLFL